MTAKGKELYLGRFPEFAKVAAGADPAWLGPIRSRAIDRFAELGFPTVRQEAWRFTPVESIAKGDFAPAGSVTGRPVDAAAIDPFTFPELEGGLMVFVDGRFDPGLSSRCPVGPGVSIRSLAGALRDEPDAVEPHLGRYAVLDDQPFVALNTAFFRDGAFVRITGGEEVAEPIQILYLTTGRNGPASTHPRTLIVAAAGSRARIVESYAGLNGAAYFTNPVTEIVVGDGATIDHARLQREGEAAQHVAAIQVHQGRDSHVTSHSISFGGRLARNDLNFVLDGEGAGCTLNGLYLASGRQHVDHHTVIDHARPNCTSVENYKGILDESARGVFHGKIVVRPDAQKTNARQSNKNLVLSEDAVVNTQPQLEIYADDVKCAHGATIGQLDEKALYYMRSRGIAPGDARALLLYGFARELTEKLPVEPVRTRCEQILFDRLHCCPTIGERE